MVSTSLPKEKDGIKVSRFEEKAGVVTTKQRSKMMSKVRRMNSVNELLVRCALWAKTFILVLINRKNLPSRPDLVIGKYKLANFVDGYFWER